MLNRFILTAIAAWSTVAAAHAQPVVEFDVQPKHVKITIGDKPFATYVLKDDKILRPFFAHVHAPCGVQVTRNHPPIAGKDAADHDTMHPGLWLAFGDLGGADFWRNRGVVRHVEFTSKPSGGAGAGSFSVRNRYEANGKTICDETRDVILRVTPAGYLLLLDAKFTSDGGMAFGDQEEMGLGVRVATAMTVKNGGTIQNSAGLKNEKQVWGKQADWCDYRGTVGGKQVGVTLMPHPDNFRRSWFHARDYGLLVANPFGQKAFTGKSASRVEVKAGETLRLRFGVLIHDGAADLDAAYADYLATTKNQSAK